MFYLNSTLNTGIPPVLVFQLEVYYKLDRLLTGLIAQLKGTPTRWYSNKTCLLNKFCYLHLLDFYDSYLLKTWRYGNYIYFLLRRHL